MGNKISLMTAPACFLEKVIRLPHRGGIRQSPVTFLSSVSEAENPERSKHLEFTRYQKGRAVQRKDCINLQRVHLEYSVGCQSSYAGEKSSQGYIKNYPSGSKGIILGSSHKARHSSYSK